MSEIGALLLAVPAVFGLGVAGGVLWRERALRGERERRILAEEQARRVPELEAALHAAREQQIRHEEQGRAAREQLKVLDEARQRLTETFKALSADALHRHGEVFMQQAKGVFEQYQGPVREALDRTHQHLKSLELAREGAYKGLEQQVKHLLEQGSLLQEETRGLRSALRAPTVAGRWGEAQLRRVVELSGLEEHCDFETQVTIGDPDSRQRPDLVVRLPGGGQVIVDAKAPIKAYLDAMDADSDTDERRRHLEDYAGKVRQHLKELASRAYWESLPRAPAFVIMYLPGEAFYQAAMRKAEDLVETGAGRRVLPAGPLTLIALLHTIALGWRDRQFTENAEQVRRLGRQLYDRIGILLDHWARLGRSLNSAVEHYNKGVRSMEARVLPAARRMNELGAVTSGRELPSPSPVDTRARASRPPDAAPAAAKPSEGSRREFPRIPQRSELEE